MNAPTTFPIADDAAIDAWRTQDRRNRHFGLKSTPLPPMSALEAESRLKRAYDASWETFGPTREEYRREVEAIRAAVADHAALIAVSSCFGDE